MRRALAVLALLLGAAPSQAARYKIDKANSSVTFKVKHLVISKVPGSFEEFDGGFEFDPKTDPSKWSAWAEIETKSIDTNNTRRDDHLRTSDFFDAERCPKISFKSTKVADFKDGKGKLHGDLTMRCVTKPVVLDLEMGGVAKDAWGNTHAGFSAKGVLNRYDYEIKWNKALEAGGVTVDENVEIAIDIEGVPEPEAEEKMKETNKGQAKPDKR